MWAKPDEAEFLASQGQVDDGLALIADAVVDSEELVHIRSPALRQRADLFRSEQRRRIDDRGGLLRRD